MDGSPFHRGLCYPCPMGRDPCSEGRTPFQRYVGTRILFYARNLTYLWINGCRPIVYGELEGMDWVRRPQTVQPLLDCILALGYRRVSVLGAAALVPQHRLDCISWISIINTGDRLAIVKAAMAAHSERCLPTCAYDYRCDEHAQE